ncbi:hypothetical protein Slin15195_G078290 [Septoria linicola]|uniref:Uncharacterized protein n=1 Tax=Septoria linicola TaxID=215465 RepID=A0A9Q9EKX3_9PEZI|nr:hypothetical protein Slin15195_G078290 [Septoria linicola]
MGPEEGATRSPGVNDDSQIHRSLQISQHDSNIKCVCPPGMKRNAKDLIKIQTDNAITWYHAPCRPFLSAISEAAIAASETLLRDSSSANEASGDMHVLTERMLTTALGPNVSEKQLQKIRNITSKFRCDGPCRGSTNRRDYFWCHLCYAWQHKPCMLFGDEGDRGRPVCNLCYVHAMMHQDDRDLWQSKRLAQAAAEALQFIRDSESKGKIDQLAFAAKFLAAFLSKNRKKFLDFVVNRHRVVRWIKARRSLPQPTYGNGASLPVGAGGYAGPQATPGAATTARRRPTRPKRNVVKSEASTSAATGDGLDDLMQLDEDDGDADFEDVDPDNIVVGNAKQAQRTRKQARAPRLRRSKRESVAFEPLVLEQSAEDEAQNERMRKAAERKARKQASSAANSSSLEVKTEDDLTPAPSMRSKRRASMPKQQGSSDEEDFRDIGIFSSKQERNLVQSSKQRSRQARKSAPSAGQLAEQGGVREEHETLLAESKPTPRNKGKQKQVIAEDDEDGHREKSTGGTKQRQIDGGELPIAAPVIMCSCVGVTSTANCYQCRRCDLFQHAACASRDCKAASLCKLCVGSGVAALSVPATAKSTTSAPSASPNPGAILSASYAAPYTPIRFPTMAPALPPSTFSSSRTPASGLTITPTLLQREPLGEAMQEEVRTLCRTILWDAYTDLPDPNDPDDRMSLDRPKLPPPSDWLAEAEKRVTMMFEVAGSDKVAEYLRHEFIQWPRNSLNIVKAMREFAMWMRLKGPFRRTRRELGLVAEILGFEDKGTYWKPDQKDRAKEETKE